MLRTAQHGVLESTLDETSAHNCPRHPRIQHPFAGMAWMHMQITIGLRHDVYYFGEIFRGTKKDVNFEVLISLFAKALEEKVPTDSQTSSDQPRG